MIQPANIKELMKLYEYCTNNARLIDIITNYMFIGVVMFGSYESKSDPSSDNDSFFHVLSQDI